MEFVREKLQKIAKLAEAGGTPGEKQAAKEILDKLLEKYNVKMSELLQEEPKARLFSVRKNIERALLMRIVVYVCGTRNISYTPKARNGRMTIYLTMAQYIDVNTCYRHYQRLFRKELKKHEDEFYTAFVVKQNILLVDEFNDTGRDKTKLTLDERLRIFNLIESIPASPWKPAKEIEGGTNG